MCGGRLSQELLHLLGLSGKLSESLLSLALRRIRLPHLSADSALIFLREVALWQTQNTQVYVHLLRGWKEVARRDSCCEELMVFTLSDILLHTSPQQLQYLLHRRHLTPLWRRSLRAIKAATPLRRNASQAETAPSSSFGERAVKAPEHHGTSLSTNSTENSSQHKLKTPPSWGEALIRLASSLAAAAATRWLACPCVSRSERHTGLGCEPNGEERCEMSARRLWKLGGEMATILLSCRDGPALAHPRSNADNLTAAGLARINLKV